MIPYTLNLSDYYKGDAWEGMSIGPITVDDGGPTPVPPTYSCVSCRMHFRNPETLALGFALSDDPEVGEGTITITDDGTYEFDIPRQVLGLAAGTWEYDFETTDTEGMPTTWFRGKLKVIQDKSYG